MKKHISLLSTLILSFPLWAGASTLQPLTSPATDALGLTPITYVCEVILVALDIPDGQGTWKFQAELKAGAHGGESREFSVGDHQVSVIADGTWLGLAWMRGQRKVGQGLFVMGPMDRALHRVGILYDPVDDSGQASIGCTEGTL